VLAGGPPPSRHGCQAPQALSTATRSGGPARARWAWWPRRCGGRPCLRQRVGVLGQRPASSVWCGCPAARVPCPRGCPVSGAGVRASRCPVSGVQRGCPVPSVGARCLWVPASTVSGGRWWRGGGGQAAAWLGWPASAWSPALSTASSSAARVGTWRSRLAQVCWVSGGIGLDLAVVVGDGWAVARSTAWATRIGWIDVGIARWWRAGVRREVATTLGGHRVRPRSSRLVAASLLGWTATCGCGRGAAAACTERRLLDAGDALTC
jgi:hypothetical protein